MRRLEGDGNGVTAVRYDEDSVFNNVTIAAAGAVAAITDPILNMPDQAPAMLLWWAASSTAIQIDMRVLDAPRGNVVEVINMVPAVDTTAQPGIILPLRDITAVNMCYGWVDVLITNNDPVNDLTRLYGIIIHQDK